MLGKIAIAAVVAVCAAVPLSQINYPQLYDQMYPVNGLKRDVLSLCTATTATFVRAVASDRVSCYDSMPDKIDLAIGWVRTSDRLAAMKAPTPVQIAEKILAEETTRWQLGFTGPTQFTGYVPAPAAARPCEAAALAPLGSGSSSPLTEPNERLARRIAKGNDTSLVALGLAGSGERRAERAMPVLRLAPSAKTATPAGGALRSEMPANTGCPTRA